MDTNQWTQENIGGGGAAKPMSAAARGAVERKLRPQKEHALNCPRCNSTNTKFCYYNNYSLTQPRYFCKTCRRYWTEGGTLRNVPVGGGSRKNKRSMNIITSSSSSSSISTSLHDLNPSKNIHLVHGQDLNLGFSSLLQDYNNNHGHHVVPQFFELPKSSSNNSSSLLSLQEKQQIATSPLAALELLRMGIGMNSSNFIPNPTPDLNSIYSTNGFSFQDLKIGGGGGHIGVQENSETTRTLMFPFGGMKQQVSSGTNTSEVVNHHENIKGQQTSNGSYWNGMLGGAAGGTW
ncbi:hypothetical protein M9H77_33110 [Catharanthus roseus]|uniref:Uncharacterized protein n=1 Tax=Catharanthus roseus TaxID=4058 RepID=A0ACB9ZHY1_CATRO|nr:hypothetical protein M9H77_33110 [Catharanthus roseus]